MLCAYTRPMQISGERLQDNWSSGFSYWQGTIQASYATALVGVWAL